MLRQLSPDRDSPIPVLSGHLLRRGPMILTEPLSAFSPSNSRSVPISLCAFSLSVPVYAFDNLATVECKIPQRTISSYDNCNAQYTRIPESSPLAIIKQTPFRIPHTVFQCQQEKGNHGDTKARRGITTNYTNCHERGRSIGL